MTLVYSFRLKLNLSCYFQDAMVELSKELKGKPDLIIGNYSDGNFVASLLAHKLGVTQVSLLPQSNVFISVFNEILYLKLQANSM